LQAVTENPTLATGAPRWTRTGVVVRETDAECTLDRVHGIILSRRRGRGVGPWSDVGCSRERTTVCQVLQCSLVHEDAAAVDRQREDGEKRNTGDTEDDNDLATTRSLRALHQYSVVMAAVATM
jgi:hypothetical protein